LKGYSQKTKFDKLQETEPIAKRQWIAEKIVIKEIVIVFFSFTPSVDERNCRCFVLLVKSKEIVVNRRDWKSLVGVFDL